MSHTALMLVIVLALLLCSGYFYAPGPWRQPGTAVPVYGNGIVGLLLTLLVIYLVLRYVFGVAF